jgi:serine/threonine-protein kinase
MSGDAEPTTLPEGTLLDGKFRIIRCIGVGGMGAVYEIQHELTKHRRALKMLHKHMASDREAVERFLREASAAGRIDNPHITETFDAGWLASGEPYLVMEFLEGQALDEWLADQPMALDEALLFAAQACRALHAAHQAGIVHRDLKPENLFITLRDEQPFLKVLDFGIGKFEDARMVSKATLEGAFMGTPYYMSPEQFIDGKKVDARSDIYSLGVILFECVTGQHPYPCDTLARLATKIMVDEPPQPSSVRTGIPSGVDAILARALRKKPEDRYPTAEAMAIDIERLADRSMQTLPQGSSWRSRFPPPADVRSAREAVGETMLAPSEPGQKTMLAAGEPEPPSIPLSIPLSIDEPVAPAPAGLWRVGALVGGAIAVAVVAWVVLSGPSKSNETSAHAQQTAEPSSEVVAPPTSAPSATVSATEPSGSASTAPRVPPPRPSSKPDFATVEEFPH